MSRTYPRWFNLVRDEDESGVSGTGLVAWGIEFPDGTCVLRWCVALRSTAVYEAIEVLEAIHGHNGKTHIVWPTIGPIAAGGER